MKEAIRKLEEQCWVQIPCDFDMDKGGLSTIRTVFDREKFARLVARDCVSQIAMIGVINFENEDVLWTVDRAVAAIKERYEIE